MRADAIRHPPAGGSDPADGSASGLDGAALQVDVGPEGDARGATVRALSEALARAAAAGDVEGARVIHEALGRALALPREGEAPVLPNGGQVLGLDAARTRRRTR